MAKKGLGRDREDTYRSPKGFLQIGDRGAPLAWTSSTVLYSVVINSALIASINGDLLAVYQHHPLVAFVLR